MKYRVSWIVDVHADTPGEAGNLARDVIANEDWFRGKVEIRGVIGDGDDQAVYPQIRDVDTPGATRFERREIEPLYVFKARPLREGDAPLWETWSEP